MQVKVQPLNAKKKKEEEVIRTKEKIVTCEQYLEDCTF
jgi:hypothetical protein